MQAHGGGNGSERDGVFQFAAVRLEKTRRRANHEGEVDPISVQIVGADPKMLAQAAQYNVDNGAQIIDINMGCPAKKICNVMAGSALLQNEPLVAALLEAVVGAVDVPVTLKIRTGWDKQNRNAIRIARIAESSGIQALAIHGRTRACAYTGDAEYDTIAAVKAAVRIPIIANGAFGCANACGEQTVYGECRLTKHNVALAACQGQHQHQKHFI